MTVTLRAGRATAVLLPEHGGRLHQLVIPFAEGGEFPVLESPEDIAAYHQEPTYGGSYPMAPWPNRVRDGHFTFRGREYELPATSGPHALHGRAYLLKWDVVTQTDDACTMAVVLDNGWPWSARATQSFALDERSLRMTLEVESTAGDAFPAGLGWHPWFRRRDGGAVDVDVQVPARERYLMLDQIPTGERVASEGVHGLLGETRLDDCFTAIESRLTLRCGETTLTMAVEPPLTHTQVYVTPSAVCIEPQTCPPDAFNLAERGLFDARALLVEPGSPLRIACEWRWGATAP